MISSHHRPPQGRGSPIARFVDEDLSKQYNCNDTQVSKLRKGSQSWKSQGHEMATNNPWKAHNPTYNMKNPTAAAATAEEEDDEEDLSWGFLSAEYFLLLEAMLKSCQSCLKADEPCSLPGENKA